MIWGGVGCRTRMGCATSELRASNMRRWIIGWIALSCIALALISPASSARDAVAAPWQVPVDISPSDLVFFTEDFAGEPRRGCDAISVFGVEQGPVHIGKQRASPSRMAAASNLSMILAIRSNGMTWLDALGTTADLYVTWRDPSSADGWSDSFIDLPEGGWTASFTGGIAITPGEPLALVAAHKAGSWISSCAADRLRCRSARPGGR